MCPAYNPCVDWKLRARLSESLTSLYLSNTVYFEKYSARSDLYAKVYRIPFSSSHGYFGWLLCVWSIREYSDPDSAGLAS